MYLSDGGIMKYFRAILGILLNALRNLKHSFDILHEYLDISVVVTNILHLTFLSELLFIFRFGPPSYRASYEISVVCLYLLYVHQFGMALFSFLWAFARW